MIQYITPSLKKFLFPILMFCLLSGCSQENHIAYLGIPIEGPRKEFCKKLETLGYRKIVGSMSGTCLYSGAFQEIDATVSVKSVYRMNQVDCVMVRLSVQSDSDLFLAVRANLEEMYGAPTISDTLNCEWRYKEGKIIYNPPYITYFDFKGREV